MSLDDINVIDAAGIDKGTGDTILSILDYWSWEDEHSHLMALQKKINAYLEFIQSGQIFEDYPLSRGKPIVIDLVTRLPLPESAKSFFDAAREVAATLNVRVSQRTIGDPGGHFAANQ